MYVVWAKLNIKFVGQYVPLSTYSLISLASLVFSNLPCVLNNRPINATFNVSSQPKTCPVVMKPDAGGSNLAA